MNEVIIPTETKDLWNRWTPDRDKYFARFYRTPILAKVMNQLYNLGVPETEPQGPRRRCSSRASTSRS